jgi:dTDP-glucose pyrophosphorylase
VIALLLAAGPPVAGSQEPQYPIFLDGIDQQLFLEHSINQIQALAPEKIVALVRAADAEQFHLDSILRQIAPNCEVIKVTGETGGAACTALLAVDKISAEHELLITSATDIVRMDLTRAVANFREREADAGVITFESLHPRYSYVRIDADGWVVEAAEKHPISRHASAGIYWFRSGADFLAAAESMILKDASVRGHYFICPSLNQLVLADKKIAAWEIPPDKYQPLKQQIHVGRYQADELSIEIDETGR